MLYDCLCFLVSSNVLKNSQPGKGKDMDFPIILDIPCVSANSKSVRYTITWKFSVFSHGCSVIREFIHCLVWDMYGFVSHEIFRSLSLCYAYFFLIFFRSVVITYSHIFGILWISAASKIFKKPFLSECLCLPILFTYLGIPTLSGKFLLQTCFSC